MATVVSNPTEKQAPVSPSAPTKGTLPFSTKDVSDASLYGTHVADCALEVRLGFVRKVFAIVAAQLLCTVTICAAVFVSPSLRTFLQLRPQLSLFSCFVALGLLFALLGNRHKSPLNMQLLAAFTVAESVAVATVLSTMNGIIVMQAAVLTGAVVCGLLLFTFQTKRDFTPLNSVLITALYVMIGISFIQIMFPFSSQTTMLHSAIGASVFSMFIIVDVQMMLKKVSTDEYILCAINLYLDILNLFLEILKAMNRK
eukprot:m.167011 g.167011  ORF g.167011 m.167011 type:complete len:256 (+) comp12767_c0_seq1:34-801(+)